MKASGEATIGIHGTDQIYKVEADKLDFQEIEKCERQNGVETHYIANLEHLQPDGRSGKFELSVWEYPDGIYSHHNFDIGKDEVIEDNMNFNFSEEIDQ